MKAAVMLEKSEHALDPVSDLIDFSVIADWRFAGRTLQFPGEVGFPNISFENVWAGGCVHGHLPPSKDV